MKKLIVGNWKMNPDSVETAAKFAKTISKEALNCTKVTPVLCPPFPYISAVLKAIGPKGKLRLGVQDVFYEEFGSYTGCVSAAMLAQFGTKYTVLGHSERRSILGETDEIIAKKVAAAVKHNIIPIIGIGEKERAANGDYLAVLRDQIEVALSKIEEKSVAKTVIAYEPVWTIGAKVAMNPRDIHETTLYIRKVLTEKFGKDIATQVPVLYGGSVNKDNALQILVEGEIDGLLIGRDSLVPENFNAILKLANSIKAKK